jgi:hypothetical protein
VRTTNLGIRQHNQSVSTTTLSNSTSSVCMHEQYEDKTCMDARSVCTCMSMTIDKTGDEARQRPVACISQDTRQSSTPSVKTRHSRPP